jgi:hypothetical protein
MQSTTASPSHWEPTAPAALDDLPLPTPANWPPRFIPVGEARELTGRAAMAAWTKALQAQKEDAQ